MTDGEPPTGRGSGHENGTERSVRKPGDRETDGDGIELTRRTVLATTGAVGFAGGLGFGSGTAGARGLDDLCETVPLDVVLVLDRSGSMSEDPDGDGNTKMADVKAAARGFVDRLTSTDRVGLVTFSTSARTDHSLTDDFGAVKTTIDGLPDEPFGGTDIAAGTDTGHGELNANGRSDATPILVVLSNGIVFTDAAVTEADEAKADRIRVMTIAFGTYANDSLLKSMASSPVDDNFFDAPTGADLGTVFETVTQQICPLVVDINVKPGSDPNAINCGMDGGTPVAVRTTGEFDATTVDPSSLRFGAPGEVVGGDGATIVHEGGHYEDALADDGTRDGDTDFVGHFYTPDTGFTRSNSEGWLVGKTKGGRDIAGRDSVKVVGNCN